MTTRRRPWSRRELMDALDLAEAGRPLAEIAALLGRSRRAVQRKLLEEAGGARRCRPLTAGRVARLLGIDPRSVTFWLRQGFLRGRQTGRRRAPYWYVEEEELHRFLADPRFWPLWYPEVITDPCLRGWALELRSEPDLLTADEAAQLIGVAPSTVRTWLRTGRLRAAQRSPRWLVRRADLERFRPPRPRACGRPRRPYRAEEEAAIAVLRRRGAPWGEVARAVGRTSEAVRLRYRLLTRRCPSATDRPAARQDAA